MKSKLFFLLAITILSGTVLAQSGLPEKPTSWVNDYAGVLSAQEKETLNDMLNGLEKRSSNQIFIAIFPQLPENYYLEDFSVKLYDKWKPGLPDKDNGILMVIFINDHKIRIDVGYGLEDVMTDAQSGTVIREYMAPEFRQGNYYAGIKAALDVMIPAAEGKYRIPVTAEQNDDHSFSIGSLILMFIIFIVISRIFSARRSAGFGSKKKGSYYSGPFWWGGFGGGGSSGGGFGGGGFSGGGFGGGFGGSSGGGGASGSW